MKLSLGDLLVAATFAVFLHAAAEAAEPAAPTAAPACGQHVDPR